MEIFSACTIFIFCFFISLGIGVGTLRSGRWVLTVQSRWGEAKQLYLLLRAQLGSFETPMISFLFFLGATMASAMRLTTRQSIEVTRGCELGLKFTNHSPCPAIQTSLPCSEVNPWMTVSATHFQQEELSVQSAMHISLLSFSFSSSIGKMSITLWRTANHSSQSGPLPHLTPTYVPKCFHHLPDLGA